MCVCVPMCMNIFAYEMLQNIKQFSHLYSLLLLFHLLFLQNKFLKFAKGLRRENSEMVSEWDSSDPRYWIIGQKFPLFCFFIEF